MISDAPVSATPTVRLENRPLTVDEATILHHELKTTPNILGYSVRELTDFGTGIVAVVESDSGAAFAGVCLCKDLLWNWSDIAVLYVLPAYRGARISSRLFAAAFDALQERSRHVFVLSRTPQIIRLMEQREMKISGSGFAAPLAVHIDINLHMMNAHRWREAVRKQKMRRDDGYKFVMGTKKHAPERV
ncbi:MAG: GNAT family N-acetyltransferase [Armatimonadetes bacterium]|nr:GNAT family N-acetyltransferase [Armatimonadota bacterium]